MGLTWRAILAAVAILVLGWALGQLAHAPVDAVLGVAGAAAAVLLYVARSRRNGPG